MFQDAIMPPVYAFIFLDFTIASVLMFLLLIKFLNEINKRLIAYGVILILLFSAFATTFGCLYTKSSIVAFITSFICGVPGLTILF